MQLGLLKSADDDDDDTVEAEDEDSDDDHAAAPGAVAPCASCTSHLKWYTTSLQHLGVQRLQIVSGIST